MDTPVRNKEAVTLQINALRENIATLRSRGEPAPALESQLAELLAELTKLNARGVLLG
jgi:uncharacterized protein involved in exopolysaccharide biosynthesis